MLLYSYYYYCNDDHSDLNGNPIDRVPCAHVVHLVVSIVRATRATMKPQIRVCPFFPDSIILDSPFPVSASVLSLGLILLSSLVCLCAIPSCARPTNQTLA